MAETLRLLPGLYNRLQEWAAQTNLSPQTAASASVVIKELFADVRALNLAIQQDGFNGGPIHVRTTLDRINLEIVQGLSAWEFYIQCAHNDLGTGYLVDAASNIIGEHIGSKILAATEPFFKTLVPVYVHQYNSEEDVPFLVEPGTTVRATATVSKVVHRISGQVFAQKTFRLSVTRRASVLKELEIMGLCDHPNIVTLVNAYEVGDEPNTMHLVISPWAPRTLCWLLLENRPKELISEFPWIKTGEGGCADPGSSDRRIYDMTLQLADAIAWLHSKEIKHKDLKPENILLRPRNEPVGVTAFLADFGVSKIYRVDGPTDYDRSTYQYLSPEQVQRKESTLRSDVWQAGCCFALVLAFVKGGRLAAWALHESYQQPPAPCLIAVDRDLFMAELRAICSMGSPPQKHMHRMVEGMLDLEPSLRPSMEQVKQMMGKVVKLAAGRS